MGFSWAGRWLSVASINKKEFKKFEFPAKPEAVVLVGLFYPQPTDLFKKPELKSTKEKQK